MSACGRDLAQAAFAGIPRALALPLTKIIESDVGSAESGFAHHSQKTLRPSPDGPRRGLLLLRKISGSKFQHSVRGALPEEFVY